MGCQAANYDPDEGRYYCEVTGDLCVYLFPNSQRCAKEWGEGPDAYDEEE